MPEQWWEWEAKRTCAEARGGAAMLRRFGKGFQSGVDADEHKTKLEFAAQLLAFEAQIRVNFQGDSTPGRRRCTGWNVHLLNEIKQSDVIALLVETGACGNRDKVTMGHGDAIHPAKSEVLPVA